MPQSMKVLSIWLPNRLINLFLITWLFWHWSRHWWSRPWKLKDMSCPFFSFLELLCQVVWAHLSWVILLILRLGLQKLCLLTQEIALKPAYSIFELDRLVFRLFVGPLDLTFSSLDGISVKSVLHVNRSKVLISVVEVGCKLPSFHILSSLVAHINGVASPCGVLGDLIVSFLLN